MFEENTSIKERIMVVDDVPDNLRLLGEILTTKYQVNPVNSAKQALELLNRRRDFDLFILDIMMPEIDGIELCKIIKADSHFSDVPVIFISALTDIKDKSIAFESGGVDYITKPFNREEVLLRVGTHLNIRRLQKELKGKNQELSENLKRLKEVERLRDNLVHMIVHDLRSPLTGVISVFKILQTECEQLNRADLVEYIRAGYYSASTLIEMINSLLDISRLEERRMPLNITGVDIRDVITESIRTIGLSVKKTEISIDLPQDPIFVNCDREIIKRVITNLINNSLKHSNARTPVIVKAERVENFVEVSVIDHGIGIPPEYHKRIFEKFTQVELRQERKKYSTGLGLTFCKLAVEAHNGRIGVESEEGKGSRFYFHLPV